LKKILRISEENLEKIENGISSRKPDPGGGIKKFPISIPKKTILKNSDNYFLQY